MKKLQLLLTNPCLKHWDDLHSSNKGRYCDSCDKHIVDLSEKTDAQLIAFFKRKKEDTCGRLLASQLGRELVLPQSKPNWHWLLPLAVGAIIVSPVQATELRPIVIHKDQTSTLAPALVQTSVNTDVTADTLRGRVIDGQSGKPLTGVKVKQKGFANVVAITDSAGKFEFSTAEGHLASTFVFELNGYSKIESTLNDGLEVKMDKEQRLMLGGITSFALKTEPMYFIHAGKQSCTISATSMKEINPDWIEKMDVLNGAKATALYGLKGANGVVRIEIKKKFVKNIDFSKK